MLEPSDLREADDASLALCVLIGRMSGRRQVRGHLRRRVLPPLLMPGSRRSGLCLGSLLDRRQPPANNGSAHERNSPPDDRASLGMEDERSRAYCGGMKCGASRSAVRHDLDWTRQSRPMLFWHAPLARAQTGDRQLRSEPNLRIKPNSPRSIPRPRIHPAEPAQAPRHAALVEAQAGAAAEALQAVAVEVEAALGVGVQRVVDFMGQRRVDVIHVTTNVPVTKVEGLYEEASRYI